MEWTYVLRLSAASIGLDELAAMSVDDHRQGLPGVRGRAPATSTATSRAATSTCCAMVTYRLACMWLDDSEYLEVARELTRLLQPRLANLPTPGRKRWLLRTAAIRADEELPGGRAESSALEGFGTGRPRPGSSGTGIPRPGEPGTRRPRPGRPGTGILRPGTTRAGTGGTIYNDRTGTGGAGGSGDGAGGTVEEMRERFGAAAAPVGAGRGTAGRLGGRAAGPAR